MCSPTSWRPSSSVPPWPRWPAAPSPTSASVTTRTSPSASSGRSKRSSSSSSAVSGLSSARCSDRSSSSWDEISCPPTWTSSRSCSSACSSSSSSSCSRVVSARPPGDCWEGRASDRRQRTDQRQREEGADMRQRAMLVVLVVMAMVVAACGGDTGSGTTQATEGAPTTAAADTSPTTAEEPTTTAGEASDAPDAITIGAVVSLTGGLAGGGAQVARGYTYAVDVINENGGVYVEEYDANLPLQLDLRDDASDPNQTTSIMDELAGGDIVAYLGGFATPVHAAGSATAERN